MIGWDLILEYGVATSAVAIGWSGYAHNALQAMDLAIPPILLGGPAEGGWINLPAALIVLTLAVLLSLGVRESARVNAAMVLVKLLAIAVFIAVAAAHVEPANWRPFMPFGWDPVMDGAALIFFAYIGFDAVSTAAEEARNPQRDLPIGILVCAGVVILRWTHPDLPRPFRTPWSPVIPALGAASCLYLMLSLPAVTWLRFGLWLLLGLAIYFLYSRRHSLLVRHA